MSKPLTLFKDQLRGFDIFKSLFSKKQIYFFNTHPLLKILKAKGLFKNLQWMENFCFEDACVINQKDIYYKALVEDQKALCYKIYNEQIHSSTLSKSLSKIFDPEKIKVFFLKCISADIEKKLFNIHLIHYYAKQKKISDQPLYYQLQENTYASYLTDYALSKKVILIRKSFSPFPKLQKYLLSLGLCLLLPLIEISKGLSLFHKKKQNPSICIPYLGFALTFDKTVKSDFYWFLDSKIKAEELVIFFEREGLPATREMTQFMNQHQIKGLAKNKELGNKQIPAHKISFIYFKEWLKGCVFLFRYLFLKPLALNSILSNYLYSVVMLLERYSYWHDFFKVNHIKIFFFHGEVLGKASSVSRNLALDKLNGISITPQKWHIRFPQISLGSSADLVFGFGPYYKDKYVNYSPKTILYGGYVSDYAFKYLKEQADKLRNQLKNAGAEFVITFFDENSSDTPYSFITNQKNSQVYEFFLKLALKNKDLGIIFKTNQSAERLMKRLKVDEHLKNQALSSQRVLFLSEGGIVSKHYPAEAALASDLTVNFLFSGTANLEAYLTGTPTVYLNLEKFEGFAEQKYPGLVFNDFTSFSNLIEHHLKNKQDFKNLRLLDNLTKQRDPFQDGLASQRIGNTVAQLLNLLKNKKMKKREIIQGVIDDYKRKWGSHAVDQIIQNSKE